MTDWIFYVLHGRTEAAPDTDGFWKVGTLPAACAPQPLPKGWTMPLRGRTSHGGFVDPARHGTSTPVYRAPRTSSRSTRVGYDAPVMGPRSRQDPIRWRVVCSDAVVSSKEVDQLIAAFADDAGGLVRDRGRRRRGGHGAISGAIEIMDGSLDLHELVSGIAAGLSTRRRLSAGQLADVASLRDQLAGHAARLRSGAP